MKHITTLTLKLKKNMLNFEHKPLFNLISKLKSVLNISSLHKFDPKNKCLDIYDKYIINLNVLNTMFG